MSINYKCIKIILTKRKPNLIKILTRTKKDVLKPIYNICEENRETHVVRECFTREWVRSADRKKNDVRPYDRRDSCKS